MNPSTLRSLVLIYVIIVNGICHGSSTASKLSSSSTQVKVSFGEAIGTSPSLFHPGVTLDFWKSSDSAFGHQWQESGVLTVDLNHPNLIAAAQALSPGVLRIGGSPSDSIIYDFDGSCTVGGATSDIRNEGKYFCSQVSPYTYGCLSGNRWKDILIFAKQTNIKLIFGLNSCYGRQSVNSTMDFSNIQKFLDYTVSLGDTASSLYAFEFGNEVTHSSNKDLFGITGEAYAADINTLYDIISLAWRNSENHQPKLIGPDDDMFINYKTILENVKPHIFSAITYHQYPGCMPLSPTDSFIMDPNCLMKLDSFAETAVSLTKTSYPEAETWLGEGALHIAHYMDNFTFPSSFFTSFFYTYQLSLLPSLGVSFSGRQTLIGGNYGLLNQTSYNYRSDLYIAYLYRRLFSEFNTTNLTPVQVQLSEKSFNTTGFIIFAFKAMDFTTSDILCVMINLSRNTNYVINFPLHTHKTRHEWRLNGDFNAPSDDLTLLVNNQKLNDHGTLTDVMSLAIVANQAEPLLVSHGSIVFAMLRNN